MGKWSYRYKSKRNSRKHQFFSVTQLCPTLCDPMNRSTTGLPVHYQLPEFTQTHVHWVSDAIQPSHPLSSPSPPAPNPSQHQSFPMSQLFAWGGQSPGISALASFLPKKSQGWSPSEWTGWISLQSKALSRAFSNTTVQMHQFSCQYNSSFSLENVEAPLLNLVPLILFVYHEITTSRQHEERVKVCGEVTDWFYYGIT